MARLTGLDVTRVDYVKRGAVRDPLNPSDTQRLLLWKDENGKEFELDPVDKAEMSTDTRNNLPNDAFADPVNRKFPHHTASGAVDKSHLANALSRIAQNPDIANHDKIEAHLERHAQALGMGDRDDTSKADSILHRIHKTLGDFFKADGQTNASGMESDSAQAIRGALDTIAPHLDNLPPEVRDAFDELAEEADYSPQESPEETPQESPDSPASPAEPTKKGDDHMPDDDKNKDNKTSLSKEELLAKAMETLPAPVREMLQKQQADLAAANERVEKSEKIAKAEREIRLKNEFVAKAEADFGYLPPVEFVAKIAKADGSGEEDFPGWAALSKSLSEKAPAEWAALEKALTTASTQLEKSQLFSEMGAAHTSVGGKNGGSAIAKIEAMAAVIAKDEKGLTKEAAISKALLSPEGRKLYKQYIEETEGAARR